MSAAAAKQYDVAVYGATGFVGKLVVEHLLSHPQFASKEFTWAVAGRSADRLAKLKKEYDLPANVGIIEADNTHPEKLANLAKSSRAIINLVGPYGAYGSYKLVELCVEHHTHYTDLSGESAFNKGLVEKLHTKAQQNEVVVAASVGYDSIPPDLLTYLGVRALRELEKKKGLQSKHVQALTGHFIKGSFSGGTVASLRHMATTDPWQIAPEKPNAMGESLISGQAKFKVHDPLTWFLPQFGKYGFRSPFAIHNTRTVYHSASLSDPSLYGPTFQSLDLLSPGPAEKSIPTWLTYLISTFLSLSSGLVFFLIKTSAIVRSISEKLIPVGTGPSVQAQKSGFTIVESLISGFDTSSSSTSEVKPKSAILTKWIANKADPGYLMTSRIISEVALLLALDSKNQNHGLQYGVRTGATIHADKVVDRFTKYAKVQIQVQEAPLYAQKLLPVPN